MTATLLRGFQVHLGGSLAKPPDSAARRVASALPATELGDYVERVLRRYADSGDGRTFAEWAIEADEADLR